MKILIRKGSEVRTREAIAVLYAQMDGDGKVNFYMVHDDAQEPCQQTETTILMAHAALSTVVVAEDG